MKTAKIPLAMLATCAGYRAAGLQGSVTANADNATLHSHDYARSVSTKARNVSRQQARAAKHETRYQFVGAR